MKLRPLPYIFAVLIITCPVLLEAKLGEGQESAQMRAGHWKQKYGAVAPIINTDDGQVVQECWSAPPEGWSQQTALTFTHELVPDEAADAEPKQIGKDGNLTVFGVGSRYRVYLRGFRGIVYDLEVALSTYKGPQC